MTTQGSPRTLAGVLLEDRLARPVWLASLALLGTVALAISAKINVPMWPVPMTMQTFVVLVIGVVYGARLGGATLVLYLGEGILGLPVFAQGAGWGYFIGTTGGYLVGFFVAAVVMGHLAERGWGRGVVSTIIAMTIGTAIIFAFGFAWLSILIGAEKAFAGGVAPFVVGAVVKIALAAAVLPFAWRLVGQRGNGE